jgi:hypothetical protein
MRTLVAVLVVAGACSGDGTSPGAITVSTATMSADYASFRWGANNDCPAGGGTQVVSVTIIGEQSGSGGAYGIGLCLPRPDQIGAGAISLGDDSKIRLDSLTGKVGDCTFTQNGSASGTATFAGFSTAAGATYTLTLAGQVPGTSTCGGGAVMVVTLALSGTADVAPR